MHSLPSLNCFAAPCPRSCLQSTLQPLWAKVQDLFKECFNMYTFPELQKKLERFSPAVGNPAAQLLLKRGRKWVQGHVHA